MHPEQWVTAEPIPDFNAQPLNCEPRPIWEPTGVERITPPRCDRLLDSLAKNHFQRLVLLGQELLEGPLAPERLNALVDQWGPIMEPMVAEDPTLGLESWARSVEELRDIVGQAGLGFQAFLSEGLIDEPVMSIPVEPTPEELGVVTLDTGLQLGTPTNFEFEAPPASLVPNGVYAYADPLASYSVAWSTESPIAGNADLRFDFTYNRGPDLYDEWSGIGVAGVERDVSRYSAIVVWLSSDRPRQVRVRLTSPVFDTVFGGAWAEFGRDYSVGVEPQAVVIELEDIYYPSWAKEDWQPGQGFPGTDAEALALVLQRFDGLIFGPVATMDSAGQLSAETEAGFLRIDNIYFR
jgi:hypothetical protein